MLSEVKAHVAGATISIEAALAAAENIRKRELELVKELLLECAEILEQALEKEANVLRFPSVHSVKRRDCKPQPVVAPCPTLTLHINHLHCRKRFNNVVNRCRSAAGLPY